MRRRGFFLNSIVLLLLIPLLLLLATYEDVSSQVIQAQSVRTQAERTYRVASYLELDFQKALEISGKRAIIAVVDYVSVTGNFISPTYMVNNTIKDLLLEGNSPSLVGYDPNRVMKGQTLRKWLMNITEELSKQGFEVSPSISDILDNMELKVAPLDSFRIVIGAKIPNITIRDVSGRIVYTGSIPSNGGYIYSIVDLQSLEDPLFSAMTGGRYYRSIRACPYSFPEILEKPIKVLEGEGKSSESHVLGELSKDLESDKIYFGDAYIGAGAKAYVLMNGSVNQTTAPIIVNTTLNGTRISPDKVFNQGDMGVLVFENVSAGSGSIWKNTSLQYRVNITITNNVGQDLSDYQIPILISSIKGISSSVLTQLFTNTQTDGNSDIYKVQVAIDVYDENGNRVPFWVEYWDVSNQKTLIWIKDSINSGQSKTYSLYFGSGTPVKGYNYDGTNLFIFFDDFEDGTWSDKWVSVDENPSITNGELRINGGNSIEAIRTINSIGYSDSFSVRFRMKGQINGDWDSGIEITDSNDYGLLFTDDYSGGNGLAIHRPWWRSGTYVNGRADVTTYNVYEAILIPTSSSSADAKFKDETDYRVNDDRYLRSFLQPLRYIYLVTDSDSPSRDTYYDFIFVRKYPDTNGDALEDSTNFNGISLSSSDVETYTLPTPTAQTTTARAYDIQPFINCIMDNRYFGVEDGWSFFERLEGSNTNHNAYVTLAHQMQDELGVKFGNQYYPIGLVSFMIPHLNYDKKLFDLFNTLGISVEEGQSSVDCYFLDYYFRGGPKVSGSRIWGISYGITSTGDLSNVPFFIDNQTAVAIFGTQGAQDLLQG